MFQPFFGFGLGVGQNRPWRALGLANPTINALVGVDDQHIFALVEAIYGANFHAIHILTAYTGFGDDVGHRGYSSGRLAGEPTEAGACESRVVYYI